jgi:NTP pyrophosphatase (non-canonical NTP hydrolase)
MKSYKEFVVGMMNPNSKINAAKYHQLLHAVMGLASELWEYCAVQHQEELIDELGDIIFYLNLVPEDFVEVTKNLDTIQTIKEMEETVMHISRSEVALKMIDLCKKYVFQDRISKGVELYFLLKSLKKTAMQNPHAVEAMNRNVDKLTKRHKGAAFNMQAENERV